MRAAKRTSVTVDELVCFHSKGEAFGARPKAASAYPRWDAAVTKAALKMTITPLAGAAPNQDVCASVTFTTGPLEPNR